jgi:hypothetical protein
MGKQLQLHNGAIKNCKKRGTKTKAKKVVYTQNAIGGGVAFVAHLHCVICKAIRLVSQGKNVTVPHRSHDKRCRINRKTKGLSVMRIYINREAAQNIAINNAPIDSVLGRRLAAEASTNINRFFSPLTQLTTPVRNVTALLQVVTNNVVATSNKLANNKHKSHQNQPSICEVMDDTLGAMNLDEEFKWLKKPSM